MQRWEREHDIVTGRLILRDFSLGDWPNVVRLLSDPDVTRFMHFASWTDEKRREWFQWCLENDRKHPRETFNWAIALRDTHQVIGWLGIGASSRLQGSRSCGYALARQFWGQGYMTEALQAVLDYEFQHMGSQRIVAECLPENGASARVMEKAGMKYEGRFYDADFEGNWAERHRYAMTREEYSGCAGSAD